MSIMKVMTISGNVVFSLQHDFARRVYGVSVCCISGWLVKMHYVLRHIQYNTILVYYNHRQTAMKVTITTQMSAIIKVAYRGTK